MVGFCLLVELHQEGSAPAAWAAGLFFETPYCREEGGASSKIPLVKGSCLSSTDRLILFKKHIFLSNQVVSMITCKFKYKYMLPIMLNDQFVLSKKFNVTIEAQTLNAIDFLLSNENVNISKRYKSIIFPKLLSKYLWKIFVSYANTGNAVHKLYSCVSPRP